MKLDRAQVEKIAVLARLKLSEEEKDKFSAELSDILTFVDQLEKLDTSKVPPTAHVGPVATPLRKDEPHQPLPVEDALRNAPERKGSAFKVPRIIE
jgi:aspartyl-tRNA(Asn)/glutamyl-tRNA(Gln) amidotransferase subunit C